MIARSSVNSPGFIFIKSRCHFREHAVLTGLTQTFEDDIYSLLWWLESVETFQAALDQGPYPDPIPRPCSLGKNSRHLWYWALLSFSWAQKAMFPKSSTGNFKEIQSAWCVMSGTAVEQNIKTCHTSI